MKAMLEIEAIGENSYQAVYRDYKWLESIEKGLGEELIGKPSPHYWCAEIVGTDPVYKLARQFLRGQKDYTHSNSKGSRGIYVYYLLESGKLYEVKEPVSWRKTSRNFYTVTEEGDIKMLTEEEVQEWIDTRLTAA